MKLTDHRRTWNRLECMILGHLLDVNVSTKTAKCYRCGRKFKVSYDMAYGATIIEKEIEED